MRVLVTGGAGFVGSHLTDEAVARGHRVIVLDDLSAGSHENLAPSLATGLVTLVEGSVLDQELVDRWMAKADICIHLAARLGVAQIVNHPLRCLREALRACKWHKRNEIVECRRDCSHCATG